MEHCTDEQWSQRLREHAQFDRSCDLNCDLSERPSTAGEALQYAAEYGSIYSLNVALQYCSGDFYSINMALERAAVKDDMHAVETLVPYAGSEFYSNEALQAACLNKNHEMIEYLWEGSNPVEALEFLTQYQPHAAEVLQEVMDRKRAEQQKRILNDVVDDLDVAVGPKRKM